MNESYIRDLTLKLCGAHAPSGAEDEMSDAIYDELCSFADDVMRAPDGSVTARFSGTGEGSIMFTSSMDEPGFMVRSYTDDGCLRITPLGDSRVWHLIGRRVVLLCESATVHGCVGAVPVHLSNSTMPKYSDLYIDIGADSRADAEVRVPLGTFGTLECDPAPFGSRGDEVRGRGLATRAGCAALCAAARGVTEAHRLPRDISFSFTCRGHLKLSGAAAPAQRYLPTDTVFVGYASADPMPEGGIRCGGGIVIDAGSGEVLNEKLTSQICRTAEGCLANWHRTASNAKADALADISAAGCRTACIRIPVRYAMSASSVASFSDIAAAAELIFHMATEDCKE